MGIIIIREVIGSKALVTGISKYAIRVIDNEGKIYPDGKMKVVGMPNINMTLPKIVRKELDNMINIIFDGTNIEFTKRITSFKKEFKKLRPSEISTKVGMNDLESKSYYVSKASRIFNTILHREGLEEEFEEIVNGDKVFLIFLKKNPITQADTIGYLEDSFLYKTGLDKYIDHNKHLEKLYTDNVQRFATVVKWDMKSSSLIMNKFF